MANTTEKERRGDWSNIPSRMRPGMGAFVNGTSVVARLPLDMLPRELTGVRRKVVSLRNALEWNCQQTHGQVSVTHSLLIQSAARFETIAAVNAQAFRQQLNTAKPELLLAFQDRILKATKKRDDAVAQLRLDDTITDDGDTKNDWKSYLLSADGDAIEAPQGVGDTNANTILPNAPQADTSDPIATQEQPE